MNYVLGDIVGDEERAGFRGRAVQRMDDEALIGGVLERGRGLRFLRGRGKIGLSMSQRVQLRGAAGKGQREREEQSQEEGLAHAWIIHARSILQKTGYFAPARHWSRPAMNKSFGSFLPINTITDSFLSVFVQGLPTSPPIIMCTPWNTTRFGLPFIHSTPL